MLAAAGRAPRAVRQILRSLASSSSDAAIQQFYSQYVACFVAGDMKTVAAEFYRAPVSVSMCVRSNTVMRSTFSNALDLEQALTFQMEGLVARGYAGKSDMQPVSITHMTDIAKLIQTEGTRYHVSGAVLEKIRASYVIERISDDSNDDDDDGDNSVTTSNEGVKSSGSGESSRWYITAIHGEIIPVLEM